MRKSDSQTEHRSISFNGVDGTTCLEFIQAIRQRASDEGKQRDDPWMADTASLCFSGNALEWFEGLEDEAQRDWKLLRRSLLSQYAPPWNDRGSPCNDRIVFTGDNLKECAAFVRSVRQRAFAEGKQGDDLWTAQLAAACLSGAAPLRWHINLPIEVRNSWVRLERALLDYFPDPPAYAEPHFHNERMVLEKWDSGIVVASRPASRDEWLGDARRRRDAFASSGLQSTTARWALVEDGNPIPEGAIQTGIDRCGSPLYSARVWYQGGVHPGKCGRHIPHAHIPWGGEELHDILMYEVLVGDPASVQWVGDPSRPSDIATPGNIKMRPFTPVEGGFEDDGRALFVTQKRYEDSWQPGKARVGDDVCCVGYGGKEHYLKGYKVLAWAE